MNLVNNGRAYLQKHFSVKALVDEMLQSQQPFPKVALTGKLVKPAFSVLDPRTIFVKLRGPKPLEISPLGEQFSNLASNDRESRLRLQYFGYSGSSKISCSKVYIIFSMSG